jgi:voltage-gated potassium channel
MKRNNKSSKIPKIFWITLGILFVFFTPIAILLWSEKAFSSSEKTWEVLTNALITLMGEYPDKPKTFAGQISQLLLLILGTFAFGAIVGSISSFFVTRAIALEKVMKQFNDHIIICNWNEKAPFIVRQLLEGTQNNERDIVIISTEAIDNLRDFSERDNLYFIQADPTHHATLEKYNALRAKSVILLADSESEGPDEKNALIALAIKHLEHTPNQRKDIYVVGELVRLDRYRHLKEAGVDEVISARDYSSGIIAQSALFQNMSAVYQQLLTYTDDTNELYFIEPRKYPQHFHRKTFPELRQWIGNYSAMRPENPIILLGIKRANGEIMLNPRQSRFDRLLPEDTLIVMAFHNIDRIEG